jgi:hypothetical protein
MGCIARRLLTDDAAPARHRHPRWRGRHGGTALTSGQCRRPPANRAAVMPAASVAKTTRPQSRRTVLYRVCGGSYMVTPQVRPYTCGARCDRQHGRLAPLHVGVQRVPVRALLRVDPDYGQPIDGPAATHATASGPPSSLQIRCRSAAFPRNTSRRPPSAPPGFASTNVSRACLHASNASHASVSGHSDATNRNNRSSTLGPLGAPCRVTTSPLLHAVLLAKQRT